MSGGEPTGFDGVVALHEQLIRTPDTEATGEALHPGRLAPPQHWTPSLEPLAPYQAVDPAGLGLAGHGDFHDIPDRDLDLAVLHVAGAEGPVHFRVLADRLLTAAEVGRLGSRIRARIEARLEALEGAGALERRGDFAGRGAQFLTPRFRDWRAAPEKTRDLDYVHDSELMLCLFRAVLEAEGIDAETAMNNGLHRIGFIRLTQNARERLQAPLRALLDEAMLQQDNGRLTLGADAFRRW
ncbi:DUF3320 domain-containing protein [Arhodomonas sp. SL1]|uniref:DUF3320 domain-containing protein n=1 Tax=Arhodomonas sp. SL1 TaxID=3425691 RepID=UPI003F883545